MDFAPDQAGFYLGDPHAVFHRLRREEPVAWYEAGGFWGITKHADIQAISLDPKLYCSSQGTQIFEIGLDRRGNAEADVQARSIIQMDPPEHNQHRKLVIKGFTPRMMSHLEGRIREIAKISMQAVPQGEVVDFVESVAVPLPMRVIAELLGIPPSDQKIFRRWSDAMIVAGGGGVDETTISTLSELFAYLGKQLEGRRKAPGEDIISTLLTAEIDGEKLNDQEILMFCMTLLVAGNETTRNLISGGSVALLENPDQLRDLRADPGLIPNAVEEMLRWVAPVQTFARRATRDNELRGRTIKQGQYVVLLYGSANRDEEVFGETSEVFDIRRSNANRHLSFGHGEHLCMGASLARLEARVLFEELFAMLPPFELAGEIEYLPSILMNGVVEMPVRFSA